MKPELMGSPRLNASAAYAPAPRKATSSHNRMEPVRFMRQGPLNTKHKRTSKCQEPSGATLLRGCVCHVAPRGPLDASRQRLECVHLPGHAEALAKAQASLSSTQPS